MESITTQKTGSRLVSEDLETIWHPYTQALTAPTPIPIVRGQGSYLYDEEGKSYFDATSSWWVNLHGHGHPYIAEKIAQQAATLEHVMFADFTHAPAIELAKKLTNILPHHLKRVFYSDNGSTAVEAAFKIAIQYHYNQQSSKPRDRIIAFRNGFHGETIAAMSASERGFFSQPFASVMLDVDFIDPPYLGHEEVSFSQLEALLSKENSACFIFEPHLQGVGGMRTHSLEGLDRLIALCRKHNVVTIADEVLTGLGRTGPLFVSNNLTHSPDIICLAKALTGGFLPLGATICAEHLYEAFLGDARNKAFLHGHSYAANPIGCVAASATIDLLQTEACSRYRKAIKEQHLTFAQEWSDHPSIARCEVVGTLLVIDYKSQEDSSYFNSQRDALSRFFLKQGLLIRPFGNSIHLMPPYCTKEAQLEEAYRAIIHTLEQPDSL